MLCANISNEPYFVTKSSFLIDWIKCRTYIHTRRINTPSSGYVCALYIYVCFVSLLTGFFYGHSFESWQYNGIALLLIRILSGFVQLHSLSSFRKKKKREKRDSSTKWVYVSLHSILFANVDICVSRESWAKMHAGKNILLTCTPKEDRCVELGWWWYKYIQIH